MATLRDLRRKIQSVGNIRKITEAMEMVAASRLRKAQTKVESSRPYALKLKEILGLLVTAADDLKNPLITPHREVKKTGVIIVAGDRGLCGSYNHNVFSASERFLKNYAPNQVELIPVGRKAVDYFQAKIWTLSAKLEDWGGKITYHQIEEFTQMIMNFYLNAQLDEVWLVYTHFINMGTREVRVEKFLNIDTSTSNHFKNHYIFEPDAPTVFNEILPRYLITKIQSVLNDAYASELAARISSMRAATKNAEEMIQELTLIRNKVRQAGITRELIEITSGADSLR